MCAWHQLKVYRAHVRKKGRILRRKGFLAYGVHNCLWRMGDAGENTAIVAVSPNDLSITFPWHVFKAVWVAKPQHIATLMWAPFSHALSLSATTETKLQRSESLTKDVKAGTYT